MQTYQILEFNNDSGCIMNNLCSLLTTDIYKLPINDNKFKLSYVQSIPTSKGHGTYFNSTVYSGCWHLSAYASSRVTFSFFFFIIHAKCLIGLGYLHNTRSDKICYYGLYMTELLCQRSNGRQQNSLLLAAAEVVQHPTAIYIYIPIFRISPLIRLNFKQISSIRQAKTTCYDLSC